MRHKIQEWMEGLIGKNREQGLKLIVCPFREAGVEVHLVEHWDYRISEEKYASIVLPSSLESKWLK